MPGDGGVAKASLHVNTVVRSRPRRDKSSADSVSAKLDRNLVTVSADTTLRKLAETFDEKHKAIVCLDSEGLPTAAFTIFDVLRFISDSAKALDGMIDLKEHKVSDLLGTFDVTERWVAMDEKTSMVWPTRIWMRGFCSSLRPDPSRSSRPWRPSARNVECAQKIANLVLLQIDHAIQRLGAIGDET